MKRCFEVLTIRYKDYLVGLLVVVGIIATFERFVFSISLEAIKQDVGLSDTQLGLMTGVAFSAFYAIAGLPIARWADRGNRVNIAAIATLLAGLMVSFCGLVTSFLQMIAVRAGIAVGEASVLPAAQSLISDYFNRSERPRVMAIYMSYFTLSMFVGYLGGGYLVDTFGWRMTFLIAGIPSILVAAIVKLTLKEPRSKYTGVAAATKQPEMLAALRVLVKQVSFRKILSLFCFGYFFGMGTSQWLPTFFIRTYDMSLSEIGLLLAFLMGGFGTLGNFAGGYFCSRFSASKERLQMRVFAVTTALAGLSSIMIYLAPNSFVSFLFAGIFYFLGSLSNGAVFAAIQSLVHERMRSVAVAITLLFGNLIGFGLGPLVIGICSDLLSPSFGENSLRYALALSGPGSLITAFYFWQVSRSIEADIDAVSAPIHSDCKSE